MICAAITNTDLLGFARCRRHLRDGLCPPAAVSSTLGFPEADEGEGSCGEEKEEDRHCILGLVQGISANLCGARGEIPVKRVPDCSLRKSLHVISVGYQKGMCVISHFFGVLFVELS
jgi:hypothetical protein